jgi:hypothetical protein
MAERDGKWISLKSSNRSMNSLVQSWVRTKSKGFDDYKSNGPEPTLQIIPCWIRKGILSLGTLFLLEIKLKLVESC